MTGKSKAAGTGEKIYTSEQSSPVQISVCNKLFRERKDVHVYHHFTRGTHIISQGHSVEFPLLGKDQGDYFHIGIHRGSSITSGSCRVIIPIPLDLECSSLSDIIISHFKDGDTINTKLVLPPGSPEWEMTLTWQVKKNNKPSSALQPHYTVVIDDNDHD